MMKGKLIKTDKGYILDGDNLPNPRKLSIQNCDEIFGILNAESEFYKVQPNTLSPETEHKVKGGFIMGFNKAMELNKDKLFTVEDMENCWDEAHQAGRYEEKGIAEKGWKNIKDFLKFLQQPKEIEVEVIMDKIPADLAPGGWDVFPKLDAENCLILKRVK